MYTGPQWGHCATQSNGKNDAEVPRRTLGAEKEPLLRLPRGRHSQPAQGAVISALQDLHLSPPQAFCPTRLSAFQRPPLPSLCALPSHRMWIRLPLIQTSWVCLGRSAANQEKKFQPLAALSVVTRRAAEAP